MPRATVRGHASVAMTEALEDRTLLMTVLVDYSLDTNNFFDTQDKKDLFQTVVDNLSGRLTDTLSAISPGGPNTWTATFDHPGTGAAHSITDPTIPADTIIIYAGGRTLSGSTIGFASSGYFWSGTSAWGNQVEYRGQTPGPTEFATWGGSITFDPTNNWHFGLTTDGLENDESDFVSTAEHELGHILGYGGDSWDGQISGGTFTGANSVAVYGGPVPATGGHWADETMSDGREATMSPIGSSGTRYQFTSLDFAGLEDIGWVLTDPPAEVDYGDAPDTGAGTGVGNYQTLASDSGPSHTIVSGLFLGASVDGDDGTLQNDRANADDVDSALPDDEDGVLNLLDLQGTIGAAPTVTLLATNTTGSAATLSGWIDFNGDGVFDNSTERAQIAVPDGTTDERFTLTFSAIPFDSGRTTYARFRLSTDAAAENSTGAATDGEVEDFAFAITAPGTGLPRSTVEVNSSTPNGPSLSDGDTFGSSVTSLGDLDGDGVNDLAVGAYGDDEGGISRGVVHVLLLNADGSVKQTVEINSSTPNGPSLSNYDLFGRSVTSLGDLDGDGVNDLAVGADGDDEGGDRRGSVHVLLLDADGSVKQTVEINSGTPNGPSLSNGDRFGRSVTSLGDLDGDGVNDLAVGAYGEGGSYRGAVHVLLLNADGSVKQTVEINSSTPNGPSLSNDDRFGSSVTSLGDLDGDGVNDLAVGADRDDEGGDARGAVHVLLLNADGSVKQTVEINSSTANGPSLSDGDTFGSSVTSPGDVDGDGVNDLAVGAIFDEEGGFGRGAVHVLLLNADGSVKQTVEINSSALNGPSLSDGDLFGSSVTSLGDLDGDGVNDVAVGAIFDDAGGSDRGAVHVLFLSELPQAESVTLPSGGDYEVLRDGDDLVVRVSGGAELVRETASLVTQLTISGSGDADSVSVLDSGTAVDTPLVFTGGDGNDSFDASLATGGVNLTGNGGNDVLIGGSANDTLNGGSGKDELVGNAGDDLVQGQGGTGDTLDGGDGNDTLNGGSGNDLIRETFTGDATLTNSTMTGRGNDAVIDAERAELTGGGAAQTFDVTTFFTMGLTSVTLDGAGGNDTLLGSDGSDVLVGSGGSDRIEGNAGDDRMIGGSGADTLIGGDGDDFIKGLGGSGDRLSGGDGNDTLNGGRGVDRVVETGDVDFTLANTSLMGMGTDVVQAIEVAELNGGASGNVIDGSAFLGFRGFTILRGNGGDDSIVGSAMSDVISGGDGNDTLQGKAGNDTLNGEDGNDGLSGFTGDDVINGGRGFDRGYGGEGNDTLTGGNAVDTLVGGDGDDSIAGNDGTDTLVGGTGNNDASPGDVITDATANIDEAFTLDPLPAWVDQV
jgi:Ca2+-binding RTX toxin-like protein